MSRNHRIALSLIVASFCLLLFSSRFAVAGALFTVTGIIVALIPSRPHSFLADLPPGDYTFRDLFPETMDDPLEKTRRGRELLAFFDGREVNGRRFSRAHQVVITREGRTHTRLYRVTDLSQSKIENPKSKIR